MDAPPSPAFAPLRSRWRPPPVAPRGVIQYVRRDLGGGWGSGGGWEESLINLSSRSEGDGKLIKSVLVSVLKKPSRSHAQERLCPEAEHPRLF